MGKKQKQNQKVIRAPELPPEVPDEDIEISDEDVKFVAKNRAYAGFVSTLDTQSITKHVTRIANAKEDDLEELYERRSRKKPREDEEEKGIVVDRVDALPVKTLDGKLVYRTVKNDESSDKEDESDGDKGAFKLTKAERRAKLKKKKKEEKKQAKEVVPTEEVPQNSQVQVLAEVKADLSAEEVAENKKVRIAELGTELLADPESNIKSLKELLSFCKDADKDIAKMGLKSSLVVFRDIIPGYRIRLPTEKELEMKISKAVKKTRFFEATLLSSYKAYLQMVIPLQHRPEFSRVAIHCLCTLLEAHPHFNFRENLIPAVVKNLASDDDVVRKLCSTTIQSLFKDEGKHGGEATVEAVQLIAELVKIHDCHLHPDSIEVFLALSFDEDLARSEKMDDNKGKYKKNKKRKNADEQNQPAINDKKRLKQELLSKTREEVNADFKATSFAQDETERKRIQAQTLSAMFNTYFRILKHTVQLDRSQVNASSTGVSLPLLSSCLKGVGLFAHFIDLDFMSDLMKHLKILASGKSIGNSENLLTVSERIECCIVAFKVMRKNLDALNVDLQDFFIQLYNLILEYRPGRDEGEIFAEALKIMLCDDRQHDMQRAAAFIKRLASSSLCFGSAESMAALVTVKNLLQKNMKCRYMLENDVGGGSVSGSVAKYQPYSSDPHLSGALASVLWELNLLSKHYHPAIQTMASNISKINTASNQVYMPTVSPQQAYSELLLEREQFNLSCNTKKLSHKRKREPTLSGDDKPSSNVDEDGLRKKFADHFTVVHDIVENEKLRKELSLTTASLQLYQVYKKR
ncbi:nucleolar complex-associated protein 3 isoform X2 [Amaranthus tricolor]|uniref:nucleolar complex-associated protein 3 isoform X2 n=1 Tax=Amaranthus tricolor TaxID=29722 RepID=UPI0025877F35|nr:nucleolar complex-associated protein 3 isoform X2 [Amaranthus tricolor]